MRFACILVCYFFSFSTADNLINATDLPSVPNVPIRPATDQPESNFHDAGMFFCQIPKNGATIMKIILCDLYRYYKGIPFKVQYSKDKKLSDCQVEQWWHGKYKGKKWEPNVEMTKIAVIRHPLKRFLSLYGYLCEQVNICGPEPNINKFAKDIYTLLSTGSSVGTGFKESNRQIIEYHAQPQSWFCNLSNESQKFHLIQNEGDRLQMRSELQAAFEAAKVPKVYSDQVLFHVVYSDTAHANRDGIHKKELKTSLEQNPQSMTYFNAIYYKDFDLFGFKK